MSSELMNLLGVVQVNADSALAQAQAWLASYPVILALIAIMAVGVVKKIVNMILVCGVLALAWFVLRGYLVL